MIYLLTWLPFKVLYMTCLFSPWTFKIPFSIKPNRPSPTTSSVIYVNKSTLYMISHEISRSLLNSDISISISIKLIIFLPEHPFLPDGEQKLSNWRTNLSFAIWNCANNGDKCLFHFIRLKVMNIAQEQWMLFYIINH